MISPGDVAVLDRNCMDLGVDPWDLMVRAGRALHDEISGLLKGRGSVLIVAGPGNNGGDGLVCAGLFQRGGRISPSVFLVGDRSRTRTDLAKRALSELDPSVPFLSSSEEPDLEGLKGMLVSKDVIVDSLLGSGAEGELRGDFASAVELMNDASGTKVAVDIPTGLGTANGFRADLTVTFHDEKVGMRHDGIADPSCGRIVVKDIGIPNEASSYVGSGDLLRLPRKGPLSKKGEIGRLLIVGGGPYTGAPALAALGAVKAGCDLVRVAVPQGTRSIVASMSPDLIVEGLSTFELDQLGPEAMDELRPLIERSHAVLVGPGAGGSRASLHLLADVIVHASRSERPLVIDADGITSICELLGGRPLPGCSEVVVTPHRGELRRLGEAFLPGTDLAPLESPISLASGGPIWTHEAQVLVGRTSIATRATVLAKGPHDLIIGPGDHSLKDYISFDVGGASVLRRSNRTGQPAMSVGGTGDVLAGLCAGFMACGTGAFDAACISAFINGRAGEAAFAALGRSMSASSMLERIGRLP